MVASKHVFSNLPSCKVSNAPLSLSLVGSSSVFGSETHISPSTFFLYFLLLLFLLRRFLTTVAENKTTAARAATSRTHWHLLRTLTCRRGGYGKGSEVLAHRGAGRGSHVPVYELLRPGLSPCLLGWERGGSGVVVVVVVVGTHTSYLPPLILPRDSRRDPPQPHITINHFPP